MDIQTAGADGKRIQSINRQILLASRPSGEPSPDNFRLAETEIPKPGSGQMLLRTVYLSLDPYMRGRMDPGPSYAPRVEIGQVMVGQSICEVVESKISNYRSGDIVLAGGGWQEYVLSDGVGIRKIDHFPGPISQALGVLGMPGLTAYTGLLNIGRPRPGETLVVAAASGAVGSVLGQIAKIKGCRVVGIAGGEEKCRFVKDELGFDDCLDHRQLDLPDRLQKACSDGIDIYFENVGGHVLEAVLPLLNPMFTLAVAFTVSDDPGASRTLPLVDVAPTPATVSPVRFASPSTRVRAWPSTPATVRWPGWAAQPAKSVPS